MRVVTGLQLANNYDKTMAEVEIQSSTRAVGALDLARVPGSFSSMVMVWENWVRNYWR